jgi:E3 Ubiquitin ligase
MWQGGAIERLIVLCVLAAAGIYGLRAGFRAWAAGRAIEDTPTSRVRSAAQGYVELVGIGRSHGEIVGPLTGLPCTWWSFCIEERRTSGRTKSWFTVRHGVSETPFYLDDSTGECLIDPRGAEVFPSGKDVWRGATAWPSNRILTGSRGFSGALFGGDFRYTEHRMRPGEPLYAIGLFRSQRGVSGADAVEATAALLREWKQDQPALLQRFDRNGDGVLDAGEWERARVAARETVIATEAARPPILEVNVLSQPDDGRAYLLAASDADTLARRYRWRAMGGIALFLGAVGGLAWVIVNFY